MPVELLWISSNIAIATTREEYLGENNYFYEPTICSKERWPEKATH